MTLLRVTEIKQEEWNLHPQPYSILRGCGCIIWWVLLVMVVVVWYWRACVVRRIGTPKHKALKHRMKLQSGGNESFSSRLSVPPHGHETDPHFETLEVGLPFCGHFVEFYYPVLHWSQSAKFRIIDIHNSGAWWSVSQSAKQTVNVWLYFALHGLGLL